MFGRKVFQTVFFYLEIFLNNDLSTFCTTLKILILYIFLKKITDDLRTFCTHHKNFEYLIRR